MEIADLKSKLAGPVDHLDSEVSMIRTGRASPSLLESVRVEAYGTKMSVKELGSVSVVDARTIVVSPWDKSLLRPLDKAIREGGLGLNPIIEADAVRVPFPQLTEERRKEFVKLVSAKVEDCRQAIRNIRQDAMKEIDRRFSDKKIGEDEKFLMKEEVEKVVKAALGDAEEAGEAKKADLMSL